jgi:hypothetical protein
MLSKAASAKAIRRLFRGRLVADLDDLFEALDTHSRMSVFRRLRDVGYLSSYTHRGRYYTLADIPTFDEYGLWRYQAIGFSRLGTIKATIAQRVEEAEAGCTHRELEALLQIQVYDTLLELVRTGRVRREPIDGLYLYLSTDPDRGSRQLAMRRQQVAQVAQVPTLPPRETVLLVLVEALHASEGLAPDSVVARRLVARGSDVSADQVAHVYAHFGLEPGKKTAVPP